MCNILCRDIFALYVNVTMILMMLDADKQRYLEFGENSIGK